MTAKNNKGVRFIVFLQKNVCDGRALVTDGGFSHAKEKNVPIAWKCSLFVTLCGHLTHLVRTEGVSCGDDPVEFAGESFAGQRNFVFRNAYVCGGC